MTLSPDWVTECSLDFPSEFSLFSFLPVQRVSVGDVCEWGAWHVSILQFSKSQQRLNMFNCSQPILHLIDCWYGCLVPRSLCCTTTRDLPTAQTTHTRNVYITIIEMFNSEKVNHPDFLAPVHLPHHTVPHHTSCPLLHILFDFISFASLADTLATTRVLRFISPFYGQFFFTFCSFMWQIYVPVCDTFIVKIFQ